LKSIARFYRLLHIQLILARHGLDRVIFTLPWFSALGFLSHLNPWNWFRGSEFNRGVAIREALEELGPIFVKFGQALSTRVDLLPDDVIEELAKLQDRVPPFCSKKARQIVEDIYKKPVEEVFQTFERDPLASASIAQVHAVTLFDGKEGVVKILRPNVEKHIRRDIQLLYGVAKLVERYWSGAKYIRPVEVVEEFEKTILNELDLIREAANASQLRRNFENSPLLYVPEIYWPYVRENILVMERIRGIPIANLDEIKRHGINVKKLAERGVEIFFTQVFRDDFFHADMHPGNIFVSYENPDDPKYLCVDFGIVGSLSDRDKRYLAENFYAFFKHDYKRVAQLHVESGWVAPDTRVNEFEAAIRTVCEPIFSKPLKEISCARMLVKLFQTAHCFNMQIQPQLILLQKTLFAVEGLGRKLYPELDLWQTALPFLERYFKEQYNPKIVMKKMQQNIPYWLEKLPDMPVLLYDVIAYQKEKQLHERYYLEQQEIRYKRQRLFNWRSFFYGTSVTFFSLVLMEYTLKVMKVTPESLPPNVTWSLISAGAVALVFALLSKRRK